MIKIKIPLTLTIIPALVVLCGSQDFAIPQVNLLELVRVEPGQALRIESVSGNPVLRLRGKILPLLYLSQVLGLDDDIGNPRDSPASIVVLQADDKTFGLIVDNFGETAEIVVKPLSKLLKAGECYTGTAIMGYGRVTLILDVMSLARMSGSMSSKRALQVA